MLVAIKRVLAKCCPNQDGAAWLLLAGISAAFITSFAWEPRFKWTAEVAAACFLVALWGSALLLRRWGGYDSWLLPLAGAANVFGLLLAFRLDPGLFYRQTAYSVLGLLLLLAAVRVARRYPRWPAAYRGLALTAMGVLLLTGLAGRQINGAKSWLFIGGVGFEPSQPALAILVLTVGMALWRDVKELWLLAAAAILLGVTHNLGAILVLILVLGGTAYLRGWNWRNLGVAAGCFLALGVVFYFAFPVVPARLALWFTPTRMPNSAGFQMIRAFQGFARGGLWGTGFVNATPENIPAAGSDFVFAVWAEIAGVWATWLILGLYLLYLHRGLKIEARAFPGTNLAARSLALLITCQAFLLAGGNTGLVPLTGVAMPFLSRGGSTIVGSYLATGMLLSLGPPGETGRRERGLFRAAAIAAGVLGLAALWRSLGL